MYLNSSAFPQLCERLHTQRLQKGHRSQLHLLQRHLPRAHRPGECAARRVRGTGGGGGCAGRVQGLQEVTRVSLSLSSPRTSRR